MFYRCIKNPGRTISSPSKPIILENKWIRTRKIGQKTLSFEAQLKLEWIIFYYTQTKQNSSKTACHFGISRKTLHKWLSRFKEIDLTTLEERSRRPKKVRSWMVAKTEEIRVVNLRKKYLKYGKKKLRVLYQQEYHEAITTWKIERVIRKYQLYPNLAEYQKRVRRIKKESRKPIIRITQVAKATTFGHIWHVDAIILWWYGVRRVIFTAIEDLTKIGYARVYGSNASVHAADF